jgi:DNA-binding NtrC family response regulator
MQATNNIGPAIQQDAPIALVAEDEILLRMALCDYLRDAGFQVLEAASGAEAQLILAAAVRVDVVISDIHMASEGEGFALAAWMLSNYPEIPVILTSGSAGAARIAQELDSRNVTDFVVKPYAQDELEKLARSRVKVSE